MHPWIRLWLLATADHFRFFLTFIWSFSVEPQHISKCESKEVYTLFFYKKSSEGPSSKSFLFIVWNTMFLVLAKCFLFSFLIFLIKMTFSYNKSGISKFYWFRNKKQFFVSKVLISLTLWARKTYIYVLK